MFLLANRYPLRRNIRKSGVSALRWSACFLAIGLAACAGEDGRTPEQRLAAWEAGNVYPTSYRAEILAYLRSYLNDPTNVSEAAVSEPFLRPMGLGNRYVACVRYNAKKSSGGYGGPREHLVVFVSGKLERFIDLRSEQARPEQAKGDQCNGATFAAFPEAERLTR
jgi:hypothetical protein